MSGQKTEYAWGEAPISMEVCRRLLRTLLVLKHPEANSRCYLYKLGIGFACGLNFLGYKVMVHHFPLLPLIDLPSLSKVLMAQIGGNSEFSHWQENATERSQKTTEKR